ncbi:MAG: hypothetical protein O2888_05885, partial [Chloroflexi bacterium]|nr:hypothetical protein [Chloroflexota bacterium]
MGTEACDLDIDLPTLQRVTRSAPAVRLAGSSPSVGTKWRWDRGSVQLHSEGLAEVEGRYTVELLARMFYYQPDTILAYVKDERRNPPWEAFGFRVAGTIQDGA